MSFSTSSGCPIISHLAFVGDVIIFCNGNRRALDRHKLLLANYERCSGQLVNISKSNFYVAPIISENRIRNIAARLGYR